MGITTYIEKKKGSVESIDHVIVTNQTAGRYRNITVDVHNSVKVNQRVFIRLGSVFSIFLRL